MALNYTALQDVATALRTCVCASLTAMAAQVPTAPGCPCRSSVVPGEPSWEGCETPCAGTEGPGGSLMVNVVRVYESSKDRFPSEVLQVRNGKHCPLPTLTAVDLDVTVLRCAPVGTIDCPPDTAQLEAASVILHSDVLAVRDAVHCCFAGSGVTPFQREGRWVVMGSSRTVGPQGGCVGSVTRVSVLLTDCLPCLLPAV